MAFSPRNFATDIYGIGAGNAQARMQLEQMRLQRQQLAAQQAAQNNQQETARIAAAGNIINSALSGGLGAWGDYQKFGLAKDELSSKNKYQEEQIKVAREELAQKAEHNKALLTQALAEAEVKKTELAIRQQEAAGKLNERIKDKAKSVILGDIGMLDVQPTPEVFPEMKLATPELDKYIDNNPMQQLLAPPKLTERPFGSSASIGLSQPTLTAPMTEKLDPIKEKDKAFNLVAENAYNSLSEEEKKHVTIGQLKGMVVVEKAKQDAAEANKMKLEQGALVSKAEAATRNAKLAKDMAIFAISSTDKYDPEVVRRLADTDEMKNAGIDEEKLKGIAKEFFYKKEQELLDKEAKRTLQTSQKDYYNKKAGNVDTSGLSPAEAKAYQVAKDTISRLTRSNWNGILGKMTDPSKWKNSKDRDAWNTAQSVIEKTVAKVNKKASYEPAVGDNVPPPKDSGTGSGTTTNEEILADIAKNAKDMSEEEINRTLLKNGLTREAWEKYKAGIK